MKKYLITILLLIITCTLVFSACTTSAAWQNQNSETKGSDVIVSASNGSEKYIVFAALNSAGNLIVRPAVGDPEATSTYAVVGYTGLVSELVIPAQYAGKNVTKVLVAPAGNDYLLYRDVTALGAPVSYTGDDARLQNNPVVTSIVFGTNVSFVGAGVCAGMTNLKKVSFARASGVTLGTSAFEVCTSLNEVVFACASGSATLNGNFSGLTPTYLS